MDTRWVRWLMLAVFVAICLAVGGIGSLFTSTSLESWYATLAKPAWSPPDRVFGPVWTVLYILMGLAAWIVWRERGFTGAAGPLALFAVQLLLNLAWSAIFFGLRAPAAAFTEILVLWVLILATAIAFWRVKTAAALLLVPYLLWVAYAATVNYGIWRLNPG